jgi:hypothetical protein
VIIYRAIFPSDTYTLYAGPEDDPSMRTAVATFNSEEGARINEENCNATLSTMQQRKPAYRVRYGCLRGRL